MASAPWQVIALATGRVLSTHATRAAAMDAARILTSRGGWVGVYRA